MNTHRIAIPVPTSGDLEYNRRSWPMYAAAVQEAGGLAVAYDLNAPAREQAAIARECQGVLLPGSPADLDPSLYGHERDPATAPADPAREAADRMLLEEAYATGKPVLGICYGVQSLNVWRGGTLVQDLLCTPVNHAAGACVGVAHSLALTDGSVLRGLVDPSELVKKAGGECLPINSSHHQAVEAAGDGLRVTGVSAEDGVIEAVEGIVGPGLPAYVVGVQWHPERTLEISATSRAIFRSFLRAVAVWEKMRASSSVG